MAAFITVRQFHKPVHNNQGNKKGGQCDPNVRRYVQLAQSRGGACFCTRGAMQGYDVVSFILALAKTVTPGGSPRREPGQAAPPTT